MGDRHLCDFMRYAICGGERTNGSAWESNPPATRLTCGSTILKTAAGTSRAGTSQKNVSVVEKKYPIARCQNIPQPTQAAPDGRTESTRTLVASHSLDARLVICQSLIRRLGSKQHEPPAFHVWGLTPCDASHPHF